MEFIICHAEVSIAFTEEKKIPEVHEFYINNCITYYSINVAHWRKLLSYYTYNKGRILTIIA